MSYHPYLKTGIKDQIVNYTASPGKEIVMLKIRSVLNSHGGIEKDINHLCAEMES